MPPFVDDKNSVEGKFFFHHPDTQINDQCLQSIICRPSHDESIPITPSSISNNPNVTYRDDKNPLASCYRVQGFAYNGAGNAIHRVEISLDGGKNWKYCFKTYADAPLRHGEKHWTWIHWYCEVPIQELCQTGEIVVRCFDASKNSQPEVSQSAGDHETDVI
jgi:nitrate reductase (NAD(P)H)